MHNFRNAEGGDRQKAMKRLRVPPLGERKSDLTTLKVGFFTGAFVCLFVTVIVSGIKFIQFKIIEKQINCFLWYSNLSP